MSLLRGGQEGALASPSPLSGQNNMFFVFFEENLNSIILSVF